MMLPLIDRYMKKRIAVCVQGNPLEFINAWFNEMDTSLDFSDEYMDKKQIGELVEDICGMLPSVVPYKESVRNYIVNRNERDNYRGKE